MYNTCLFCSSSLGANDLVEHFTVGRCLAFDAAKGRLWAVCSLCGRWNLTPLEERWEAIEECERLFRGTFVRTSTRSIGLARLANGVELIRIGAPLRPEFAAWRYSSRFGARRRRALFVGGSGALAAAATGLALGPMIGPILKLGAISIVVFPGVTTVMGVFPIIGTLAARDYVEHDRVVARLARDGRVVTVRAKHVRDAELEATPDGAATLLVPHDTGWLSFSDAGAIHTAAVLLAGANRFGAPAARVDDAVRRIEDCGDANGYLAKASAKNLWRRGKNLQNAYRRFGALHLSPSEALALEMSVHEETERRAMQGELAILEQAWRDAEEIAAICDDDLTPPKLYQ